MPLPVEVDDVLAKVAWAMLAGQPQTAKTPGDPHGEGGSSHASMSPVTLILGMSQPEGFYVSVDYRVTDARTGAVIDDSAVKYLVVQYPPLNGGGPKAFFAYTGVAILPDGTPVGAWIRETLRGEAQDFNASMRHLVSRLNRDAAPLRRELIVNVAVMQGERRFFGALSNLRLDGGRVEVSREFGYTMKPADRPFFFANGSGARAPNARKQFGRLQRQVGIRARRPADYLNLLALVNRAVSERASTVSPFCHATFLNSPGQKFNTESRTYTRAGESVPFEMPFILAGLDFTGELRRFAERARPFLDGDTDEIDPFHDDQAMEEDQRRRP